MKEEFDRRTSFWGIRQLGWIGVAHIPLTLKETLPSKGSKARKKEKGKQKGKSFERISLTN